nr:hypothetical protein [Leptospira interrogans]
MFYSFLFKDLSNLRRIGSSF